MKVERNQPVGLSGSAPELESDHAFIARLLELAAIAGGKNALARAADVSQGGLQRYFRGGEPTRPVLIRLAQCTGVSLLWLMTGEGPKVLAESAGVPLQEHPGGYTVAPADAFDIPVYGAHCSNGKTWRDASIAISLIRLSAIEIDRHGLDPRCLSAVVVSGDAMREQFKQGDAVIFDHSRTRLEAEALYVIRMNGYLQVKRLQRQLDGSVSILSQNPAYRDVNVSKDQLELLEVAGLVVWAGIWLV